MKNRKNDRKAENNIAHFAVSEPRVDRVNANRI